MGEHWKVYEPIEDVVVFDNAGIGPFIGRLDITANVHPNENYPECRIVLGTKHGGSVSLTVEQSAKIRALLERAEEAVKAGMAGCEVANG